MYDSRDNCNAIIRTATNTLIAGCKNTVIPNSVTSIGNGAFAFCYDLTSVTIPNSVTYIGEEVFGDCSSLTSVTIPNSVTFIGDNAFSNCSNLTEVTIPNSVTSIENGAFCGCSSLTSVTIPNSVTYIGDHAFSSCSSLTSVTIPNSVTYIGDYAFASCYDLKSVTIPNSVTSIGNGAFAICYDLTSVTIPNSVTYIGDKAFSNCSNLTEVTIPNSVTSIGDYAFSSCSGLTSVTIPKSVTSIGDGAFWDCSNLTSVTVKIGTPLSITSSTFTNQTNATLYVPYSSKAAYVAADYWKEFKEIVECDYVEVENQTLAEGQSAIMEIGLNNFHSNLVGFQMDLTLPDGVGIDKTGCALSSRITDAEQELTIGKLENGAYRLTSTSLSLKPIDGTDGTLLTLKLTATEDCVGGNASLSNIIFSTSTSEKVVMNDEGFNIRILHKYTLTYVVDGEVYKTEEVLETTPLTPETEPTKDGYTFGGWSELPETMPARDVVVTGNFYHYGDVNTDEEVDVVDVVDIARFVVATPSDSFRERLADLNYDATVNIADAVTLVNYIAGDQNFVKAAQSIGTTYDYTQCQLLLQKAGQRALSLCLNGDADFTAFQFEVELPANTDISEIRINGQRNNGHQLIYNKVSDNRYRVVALSLSNAIFNGNKGELLNISIDGLTMNDVCIHDIHFVTINGTDVTFDSLYLSGNETRIADVDITEGCTIYDLQGRCRNTLQRGLNIVGNKVYIKK